MSRSTPCCHTNERVWVTQPRIEYWSFFPFDAKPRYLAAVVDVVGLALVTAAERAHVGHPPVPEQDRVVRGPVGVGVGDGRVGHARADAMVVDLEDRAAVFARQRAQVPQASVLPGERVHQVAVGEADDERVEVRVIGVADGRVRRAEQAAPAGERDGREVEKGLRAAERARVGQRVGMVPAVLSPVLSCLPAAGVRWDRGRQRGHDGDCDQRA
jgi:hypothetical protein